MAKQRKPRRGDAPLEFTRADIALLRRAAREKWGVPDAMKTEAIHAINKVLVSTRRPGLKLAAIKLLSEFDRIDQADDRGEKDEEAITLAKAVLKMQADAREHDDDDDDDDDEPTPGDPG